MATPTVKLTRGIHVMHLFYSIDRVRWGQLPSGDPARALTSIEALVSANSNACQPRITTYANVGGKADVAFIIYAEELGRLSQLHREVETSFPAGTLQKVYSYLSVTELPEYVTTEDDMRRQLTEHEKLEPDSDAFNARFAQLKERHAEYEHYRLYPELPDWEVMGFYPMSKRRQAGDNWYSLDFATRKRLMGGHARVGRKYGGRITQLITGSTGLDDWEWGVTLVAHQTDSLKDIVYEMRFDEVSARYGEFGPFFINLRLQPADLWEHLKLR